MKESQFRSILKECVREVFREEVKDILLEAVKAPKSKFVSEQASPKSTSFKPSLTSMADILKETSDEQLGNVPFNMPTDGDSVNGELPAGDIPEDMLNKLIGKNG